MGLLADIAQAAAPESSRDAWRRCAVRGARIGERECPTCRAGRTRLHVFACPLHAEGVTMQDCARCSQVQVEPPVVAYDLAYYDRTLRQNSADAEAISRVRWEFVRPVLARVARPAVLDYGAGVGWFRAWMPAGVMAVDTVDVGPAPQTGIRRAVYDLVTFWDVLEHLPDLAVISPVLRAARAVAVTVPIRPEGVPAGEWKHNKPGEHLREFTPETLLDLMERHGLKFHSSGYPECPPRQDILSALFTREDQPTPLPPRMIAGAPRQIILRQGQSPGDILSMTRAVHDLKTAFPAWQIDVRTPTPELWENCPDLTPLDEQAQDVEIINVNYGLTARENGGAATGIHASNRTGMRFVHAFHECIETALGVTVPRSGYTPMLWISDEEKRWTNQVVATFKTHKPFWLLNAGYKQDNELKAYPYWQQAVDLLNAYFAGRIHIVQIGHAAHRHPTLSGVLSLVGKTSARQLIRLAWHAQGILTPLSFPYVLAAALNKPCVCVAGGKEGVPWHIYPNTRYLYTNGALDCCPWDGCWLGGTKGQCRNLSDGVPRCFRLITPQMIADGVRMYYDGGRLKL